MSDLSPEEAHAFVAKIRSELGGVSAKVRDIAPKEILDALQSSRRKLANTIKIMDDSLYSKETRFFYEIFQNAEDNNYRIAKANGKRPFLTLKLSSDKMIVESNEDGFSEKNVEAICSAGQSTKIQSEKNIGEKGIGFKSVFKVASKVHIQSGPFSFAFSHTRENDDDGLGMITPYDEHAETLPPDVRTRLALSLLDPTRYDEQASELCSLSDTFLMFLSQLQRLSIELHPPGKSVRIAHYSKRETKENHLYATTITKKILTNDDESIFEQRYYTYKRELQNLPSDDARKDQQGNSVDTATVILAFPVDKHDEPVLQQQYTYAFLPLRQIGFKFLIQADFIIQANREDVVQSARNQAILGGVAEKFMEFALLLCKHPTLKYQWMRYLPDESIPDSFWGTLGVSIQEKLKETPSLESWNGNRLYKPSELKRLREIHLDKDGHPLLRDLVDNVYLSPKYEEEDFQILKRLGTSEIDQVDLIVRLAVDIRQDDSLWKQRDNDADWRTRICSLFYNDFAQLSADEQNHLKELELIPLDDGIWVSSISRPDMFFPMAIAIPIPTDLGICLVSPIVTENRAWTRLLERLGVIKCPKSYVVKKIQRRYVANVTNDIKLSNAVDHIRFLFWADSKDEPSWIPQIQLMNQYGSLLKTGELLYFPIKENDYSPSELFKQDTQLPGLPVHYLHDNYLKVVCLSSVSNEVPYSEWLEKTAHVRRIIKLKASSSGGLSKEFRYIIDFRSDRLLGMLKREWAYYQRMDYTPAEELRRSNVLLENGCRKPLHHTFLPFPTLKQITDKFEITKEFPFVATIEPLRDDEKLNWEFVKKFQVGVDANLKFYISALETFRRVHTDPSSASLRAILQEIYQKLQSTSSQDLDRLRKLFKCDYIWIPPSSLGASTWLSSEDCVWKGPPWLSSKRSLLSDFYEGLEHLLKIDLKISDATAENVIDDLLALSYKGRRILSTFSASVHKISTTEKPAKPAQDLYFNCLKVGSRRYVPKLSTDKLIAIDGLKDDEVYDETLKRYDYVWQNIEDPAKKEVQSIFENFSLIYLPTKQAWYSPSSCVWAESNVHIPEKVSIASAYKSRKPFFTNLLKIQEPTVEELVRRLISQAEDRAPIAKMKETITMICSTNLEGTNFSGLMEAEFLPIELEDGTINVIPVLEGDQPIDYVILDRMEHVDAFHGKTASLDFSLEEIQEFRPLLSALNLERRFSSRLVREVTEVKEGTLDVNMTKLFRLKSQSIIRCAIHFHDLRTRPDIPALYQKLSRVRVYLSDSISCSLQIRHNKQSIESTLLQATFHLADGEDGLRLYLPRDKADYQVCLDTDLPNRLCKFLEITDPNANNVIGGVFRRDDLDIIARNLKKAGVCKANYNFAALDEQLEKSEAVLLRSEPLQIEEPQREKFKEGEAGIKRSEVDVSHVDESDVKEPDIDGSGIKKSEAELAEAGSDTETLIGDIGNAGLASSNVRSYEPTRQALHSEGRSSNENVAPFQERSIPAPSCQVWQKATHGEAYTLVLEHVVKVAKKRAQSGNLGPKGVINWDPSPVESLSALVLREAFQSRTQERDFRLGAAGELYVFEYLKELGLPGFGLHNWKSQIRSRVRLHPDYHDIRGCYDRNAIADIEFEDQSGKFTQLLRRKGYLLPRAAANNAPFYHIEVKTTKSHDYKEPFYMSKAQKLHIEEKRFKDMNNRTSIYMICRIFNLGTGDSTGVHIYVDPETKRRDGELEFTPHVWAVKPSRYPFPPCF